MFGEDDTFWGLIFLGGILKEIEIVVGFVGLEYRGGEEGWLERT